MLGTACVQAVSEREMSRDVGEGSSVSSRGPGNSKVRYPVYNHGYVCIESGLTF